MGIIRAGILGKVSGKVAGVVGAYWKNKAYLREYAVPSNPRTAPQQIQRAKFISCVRFCKALVGPVFNAYTDRFQKTMSGFNRFIASNIINFEPTIFYNLVKVTEGPLWGIAPVACVKTGGNMSLGWVGNLLGNNGAGTDKVYGAAYNKTTHLWYFPAAEVLRSDIALAFVVPAADTDTDFQVYVWAMQRSPTSTSLINMISNSQYIQAT